MAHATGDLAAADIDAYLYQHEHKTMLRFITCGSVDDGKSTLIGRLLYDSKLVFEDHLAALESDSKKVGTQGGELDFALLVDGSRGRTRAGHHDRRRLPVLLDREAQVHRGRHTGPRAVHPQHGDRSVDRGSRGDPDRRPQRRPHADPPALASSCRCWASAKWCWRSTSSTSRTTPKRSSTGSSPTTAPSPPRSACTTSRRSRSPRCKRRQHHRAVAEHDLVRGADVDRSPRDRSRSTTRSTKVQLPDAGAVGEPPQPRLPRLLRRDRRRRHPAR